MAACFLATEVRGVACFLATEVRAVAFFLATDLGRFFALRALAWRLVMSRFPDERFGARLRAIEVARFRLGAFRLAMHLSFRTLTVWR